MSKYNTLLNILDQLCGEAPASFKSYHPDPKNLEHVNQARSKAFIHLYLKVKFGFLTFKDRQDHIVDKGGDGGVDAYFIDEKERKLYLIQSKFRTNEENFEGEAALSADDLIKMEVSNILCGNSQDSQGVEFNSMIKDFQKRWAQIKDHAKYAKIVIILGNLRPIHQRRLQKIVGSYGYDVVDFRRVYDELVLPLCQSIFCDPDEITVEIDLLNKEKVEAEEVIATNYGNYRVHVLFVPTKEMGRILSEYKNAILKYNPRNYLSLAGNPVNKAIQDSIEKIITNDFAVFNNGITMLADSFEFTEETGKAKRGQAVIARPQIINGGQTVYTLSKLYEKELAGGKSVLGNKEVLLKVISRVGAHSARGNGENEFIAKISNATNQQTKVEEADRRSNATIQVELQERIFKDYGYFYERKRGEFFEGLEKGYMDKKYLVRRDRFLRAYHALQGHPSEARSKGRDLLFREKDFNLIIPNLSDLQNMVFAYKILERLRHKSYIRGESARWGSGLKYGKLAIVAAIAKCKIKIDDLSVEKIDETVENMINYARKYWKSFERWAKGRRKNRDYFKGEINFDNYYKGKTLNLDIEQYFK